MDFKNWHPFSLVDPELLEKIRLACVFGRSVIFVTYDDEVYGFGPNSSGCLGVNGKAVLSKPVQVTALNGKLIKEIAFGGVKYDRSFVVASTLAGEVYYWGKRIRCTSVSASKSSILKPILLNNFPKTISTVACGFSHFLALSLDGKVYCSGLNTYGQLGTSTFLENWKWDIVENSRNIVENSCGFNEVRGQLLDKRVIKIACGSYFSTAVDENGQVFTWGCNVHGQLGHHKEVEKSLTPEKVCHLNNVVIKKIACGPSHVLAVSDIGELYAWGDNACGQLGFGDTITRRFPVKNANIGRVIKIGATIYCPTSAALTEKFEVFMWGDTNGVSLFFPQKTLFDTIHEVFARFATPSMTYKSFKPRPDYGSLNKTIKHSFDNQLTSDLTIIAEDQKIFVHKVILGMQSEYFRALLQDHWHSEHQKEIQINRKYSIIYAYLKYLYTRELKTDLMLTLDILELVHEYHDEAVLSLCEKIIQRLLTPDNCAVVYAAALKFNKLRLRENCVTFISHHTSAVIQSAARQTWDIEIWKEFSKDCLKSKLFKT